jgi:hypothetical protein
LGVGTLLVQDAAWTVLSDANADLKRPGPTDRKTIRSAAAARTLREHAERCVRGMRRLDFMGSSFRLRLLVASDAAPNSRTPIRGNTACVAAAFAAMVLLPLA